VFLQSAMVLVVHLSFGAYVDFVHVRNRLTLELSHSIIDACMPVTVLLILSHVEKFALLLSHSLTASLNAGIGSQLQWWIWVKPAQM